MHKVRAFFFACAGVLCLALAYHLGARSAGAQAPANPVVGIAGPMSGSALAAITANGDVYTNTCGACADWTYRANIFTGSPTPAMSQPTWGQVKAKYATPKSGAGSAQDLRGR